MSDTEPQEWSDVTPTSEGLRHMMEGRTITSVKSLIFEDGDLFRVILTLDNGFAVKLEAVAMHGMEARIQVSIPREYHAPHFRSGDKVCLGDGYAIGEIAENKL